MTQEQFFNRFKFDTDTDFLGGGGFGKVYKAFDETRNRYVAIKVSEVRKDQESLSLMNEVNLAASLPEHKNVAHYESCFRFKSPFGTFDYGILQYYPSGNLYQLLISKNLTQSEKEHIANGIIAGLQHLHNNNIIHRDLKSANILIAEGYNGEFVPKIADFGLSKQFTENDKSYFSNSFAGGSLHYVAPEQLEGKELRKNVDLWSLGVILYELFAGEKPFKASLDDGSETARAEIISKIKNSTLPTEISLLPHPWQGIIKSCLIVDPIKRIKSLEDIMKAKQGIQDDYSDKSLKTEVDKSLKKNFDGKPNQIHKEELKFDNKKKKILFFVTFIIISSILGVYFIFIRKTENINTNVQDQHDEIPTKLINNRPYIKMILVPGKSFLLSETEVTIGQYLAFCRATNSCWPDWLEKGSKHNIHTGSDEDHYKMRGMSESNTNHPITGVSAIYADAFCKWMGGRLPTKAEWQFAAKGGENYKYAGSDDINEVAWYDGNSKYKIHPVRLKKSNGYGFYDMTGNVREWTSTKYGDLRVIQGGSWLDASSWCEVDDSDSNIPGAMLDHIGFRFASSR